MKIGLLQSEDICYNSLNYFMDSIGSALADKGVEVQKITEFDNSVLETKWDAMIGINNSLVAVKLEDGTFLMDFFNCPVFNILVDPPYYHHSILESHMERLHLIVLDEGHVEYCKKYYGDFESVEMAYLLGAVGEVVPYEEKKIDILFAGSLVNEDEMKIQASKIYNAEWADAIFELLIQMGKRFPDNTTESTLKAILKENAVACSEEEFKVLMNNLGTYSEFYLRGYYRRKIVTTLVDAGLTVHVAGNGWEKLYPECPKNLVLEGSVDFSEMAGLTAKSKLVLNVMPWFKEGIHDRVPTAMLNGSVCVTDSSTYIDANFEDGRDIILFRLEELDALPDRLRNLLNDEEKMKSVAESGKLLAEKQYTWDRFVNQYILKVVSE